MQEKVTIRISVSGDEASLFELWRETFGDEDEYIQSFFSRFYAPGSAIAAVVGSRVISAMYLVPAGTLYSGGSSYSCCCLYALSTLPEYQGRGIASAVLSQAAKAAFALGYDCAYLCPADEGLFEYYENRGFTVPFSYGEQVFLGAQSAPPVELEPVSAEEYIELRETMLENIPHMEYNSNIIAFQQLLCRSGGADLWRFDGGCGAAEVLSGGRTVIVKELLCADELVPSFAAAISRSFSTGLVECRTPVLGGSAQRIALARFRSQTPESGAWVPFAFD